ncbi:MAG: DUF2314 domain-containing protein [bacterium]|nr:DUF2314 domain-containing protein [bacterium]
MKNFLLAVCLVASIACVLGCEKKPDDIVGFAENDPEILAAKAEAQRRWPEFVNEFKQRKPEVAYAIKAPFPTKSGSSEHMWVQVTEIQADKVVGVLDNDPYQDCGVRRGDTVTVALADVEDWMVADGEIRAGGFSVPAVAKKLKSGG